MSSARELGRRLGELFVAPEGKGRGNNVNLMRFLAASAVIYGHMGHLIGVGVPSVCGEEVSTLAVKVFFLLSGFLIAESFLRDGQPFRYLVRRVFRIIPGLVFVVLVSILALGPLVSRLSVGEYFGNGLTWRYLLNCVLNPQYALPGVFETNPYPNAVNGSLWTLPVEFAMYLIMPAFLVLFKRLRVERPGIVAVAAITAVLSILSLRGNISVGGVVWGTSVRDALVLVPYFFIGSFLAVTPGLMRIFNPQLGFLALLAIATIAPSSYWTAEVYLLLFLPYATFAFSFAAPAAFERVFAVNDYSYGIYLWAFPVQQTLVWALGADAMGLTAYSVVAFAVTLPCAMLSWFAVERPASRLGRRLTSWSKAREKARVAARCEAAATSKEGSCE